MILLKNLKGFGSCKLHLIVIIHMLYQHWSNLKHSVFDTYLNHFVFTLVILKRIYSIILMLGCLDILFRQISKT